MQEALLRTWLQPRTQSSKAKVAETGLAALRMHASRPPPGLDRERLYRSLESVAVHHTLLELLSPPVHAALVALGPAAPRSAPYLALLLLRCRLGAAPAAGDPLEGALLADAAAVLLRVETAQHGDFLPRTRDLSRDLFERFRKLIDPASLVFRIRAWSGLAGAALARLARQPKQANCSDQEAVEGLLADVLITAVALYGSGEAPEALHAPPEPGVPEAWADALQTAGESWARLLEHGDAAAVCATLAGVLEVRRRSVAD